MAKVKMIVWNYESNVVINTQQIFELPLHIIHDNHRFLYK